MVLNLYLSTFLYYEKMCFFFRNRVIWASHPVEVLALLVPWHVFCWLPMLEEGSGCGVNFSRQTVNPLAQRPQQWSHLTFFSIGLKPPPRWKLLSQGLFWRRMLPRPQQRSPKGDPDLNLYSCCWESSKIKHHMTTCWIDIVGGLWMLNLSISGVGPIT